MRRFAWLLIFLLLCSPALAASNTGRVSWVYDGDTLKIDGIGKVRLLGIDTPEKEDSERDGYYRKHYQLAPATLRRITQQALHFNLDNVKGKRVQLRFDNETNDRYGRILAYVYLPDGRMLNRLLLEKGLASVYRRFDFRHKQDFLQAEQQARKDRLGLWQ